MRSWFALVGSVIYEVTFFCIFALFLSSKLADGWRLPRCVFVGSAMCFSIFSCHAYGLLSTVANYVASVKSQMNFEFTVIPDN